MPREPEGLAQGHTARSDRPGSCPVCLPLHCLDRSWAELSRERRRQAVGYSEGRDWVVGRSGEQGDWPCGVVCDLGSGE